MENQLKNIIVIGVTLIWRKAVAVSMRNSYRPDMALFKFDGFKIFHLAAKLSTPLIILHIWYVHLATIYHYESIYASLW